MKCTIKYIILELLIFQFVFCSFFRADGPAEGDKAAEYQFRFALDNILIYDDILMEKSIAELKKGEKIILLETVPHPYKIYEFKPLQMARVRLENGITGYREASFFALRVIVIIDEEIQLYTDKDEMSVSSDALAGSAAFVTEQADGWLEVDAVRKSGYSASGRWMTNRGFTEDAEMTADALLLDGIRELFMSGEMVDEENMEILFSIAEKENAVGVLAYKTISDIKKDEAEEKSEEDD